MGGMNGTRCWDSASHESEITVLFSHVIANGVLWWLPLPYTMATCIAGIQQNNAPVVVGIVFGVLFCFVLL